jgi:hypothetical protein
MYVKAYPSRSLDSLLVVSWAFELNGQLITSHSERHGTFPHTQSCDWMRIRNGENSDYNSMGLRPWLPIRSLLTMGLWPRTTISSLSQGIEVVSRSILRPYWDDVIGVTAAMHYLICGSWTRLHHVCDGATWDRDIDCWVHEEPHVHMFPFFFWRYVTQDRNITRTEHGNASCTCLLVGLVSHEIWIRCLCGITTSHLFPHLCSKTATPDKDVRRRRRRHEVDLMQACRPLHFER